MASKFFTNCLDSPALGSLFLANFREIFLALMFLSHAKFSSPKLATSTNKNEFVLTPENLIQLKQEQNEFKAVLSKLLDRNDQVMVMKHLMVIHGLEKCPKYIRLPAMIYLKQLIAKKYGVLFFIATMCRDNDYNDTGKHWRALESAGTIIALSHSAFGDEYYDAISSQVNAFLTKSSSN